MSDLLLPLLVVVFLFAWVITVKQLLKQSKKDWDTLKDLKEKADKVKTRPQIEALSQEVTKKLKTINNSHVSNELYALSCFLRGLYQNANKR